VTKEAVGEASGGGATVECDSIGDVDTEMVERRLELLPPTAGITPFSPEAQAGVGRYSHTRLIERLIIHQHLPGHNPASSFVFVGHEMTLNQQVYEGYFSDSPASIQTPLATYGRDLDSRGVDR
jgi:hypothetical protein